MVRRFAFSLLFILSLSAVCSADPVTWKLGDEDIARYRIDASKKATNKNERDVKFPGSWPVSPRNLDGKTLYKEPPRDLAALIYRYAFTIPKGLEDKATQDLSDKLNNVSSHGLKVAVKGKVKRRGSGKKVSYVAQVELSQNGKVGASEIKKGSLQWSSIFDSKKGLLLSCNFVLNIEYTHESKGKKKDYHYVAEGRLILMSVERAKLSKFKKEVANAIKNGSKWLRDETRGNISKWSMGHLSLSLFALLRSGLSPRDQVIQQGFQRLATMTPERTYDVAVYIMALEARSVKRIPPKGSSSVPRYQRGRVGKGDLAKIQELANFLVKGRIVGYGRWDYTPVGGMSEEKPGSSTAKPKEPPQENGSKRYDNSVTQFAVLALHAAHRAGAKIDHKVWEEVFEHFLTNQRNSEGRGSHRIHKGTDRPRMGQKKKEREGRGTVTRGGSMGTEEEGKPEYRGWSYTGGGAYGSMTNAGLSSLAIAASMLEEINKLSNKQDKEFKRMTREGLAWQAKNYTVTTNPKKGGNNHYFYYMYSLEKACELLGVEGFDGQSWYDDGARRLCIMQDKDGSWSHNKVYTSFSLIFLNRATLRTTINILKRRTATGEADASARTQANIKGAGGSVDLKNILEAMIGAGRKEQKKYQKWFDEGLNQLQALDRALLMPTLIELMKIKETKSFARKKLRSITSDSSMKTEEDFQKWYEHWRALDRAGEYRLYNKIPFLKSTLAHKNRILRQAALLAAARLMAVELVKDIAPFLDQAKEKQLAANCLLSLMGRNPSSRVDAEQWASEKGPAALKAQASTRRLFRAIRGDAAATKSIMKNGKKHLPQLTRLVKKPAFKKGSQALLVKITGKKLKGDAWSKWWRENKDKIKANGRL